MARLFRICGTEARFWLCYQLGHFQLLCQPTIDYRAARGLDKSVMRALTQESAWVKNHENIFVLGPTGVGKSFVASAPGAEGLPRWIFRVLHARGRDVSGVRPGSR
jgi:hypothetical protein